MTVEEQVRSVAERIERDDTFVEQMEQDAVSTLRHEGFGALADEVERERERIAALAERIASDDDFRARIEVQPRALTNEGIPAEALQPVLAAVGAPDELIEAASSDVEAHLAGKKATAAAATAAIIGAFAFAGEASAASDPSGASIRGSVDPSAVRYGAEPNPLRKNFEPNPFRYKAPGAQQPGWYKARGAGAQQPQLYRIKSKGSLRAALNLGKARS